MHHNVRLHHLSALTSGPVFLVGLHEGLAPTWRRGRDSYYGDLRFPASRLLDTNPHGFVSFLSLMTLKGMAERVGFEPMVSCPTPHFECGAQMFDNKSQMRPRSGESVEAGM